MVYNILAGKTVTIPEDTEKYPGITFIDKGIKYIILSIKWGDMEVMPFDDYIKKVKVQKCEDGQYRTLKEIEDMEKGPCV